MAITIHEDGMTVGGITPMVPMTLGSLAEEGNKFEKKLTETARREEAARRQAFQKYRADMRQRVDDAVLGFDSFEPGSSDEVKRRKIIRGVMKTELGSNPRTVWGYDSARQSAARRLFDGEGGESDEAFFGKLQERATKRKEEVEFYDALDSAAVLEAFRGGGTVEMDFLGKFKESDVLKREQGAAVARWKEVREAMKEEYGDVLPAVQNTFMRMRTGGEWVTYAAGLAESFDDEQKEKFLMGLREVALSSPTPEIEGGLRKMAVNWHKSKRGVDEAFRNAGTGAQDMVRSGGTWGFAELFGSSEAVADAKDRQAQDAAWAEAVREKQDFIADVRRVFEGDFDPIRPLAEEGSLTRAVEEGIYAAPGAVATTLQAAAPGVGLPMVFGTLMEGERQKYRGRFLAAGMSRDAAAARAAELSAVSAAPQMILEKIQAGAVVGKIPGVEKIFNAIDGRVRNRLARGMAKFAVAGVAETGVELTQDIVSDLVQDVAHEFDKVGPDVDWLNGVDGHFDGYFNKSVTTFVAVAPLAVLGAVGGLSAEKRAEAFRVAPPLARKAYGFRDEDMAKLDEAETPRERVAAMAQAFENRDPNSEAAQEAAKLLEKEAQIQKEAHEDLVRMGLSPGVRMTPGKDGFEVYNGESGETIMTVETASETAGAVYELTGLREKASEAEFDALVTKLEASKFLSEGGTETVELEDLRLLTPEEAGRMFEGSDDRLAREEELLERAEGGTGAVSRAVFGAAVPAGIGGRNDAVTKLFRGSSIFTLVHEKAHHVRRVLMAQGQLTAAEQVSFFRRLNKALEGRTTREGNPLTFQGFDSETVDETALDEAWAQFAEVMLLRSQNGRKSRMRELLGRNVSAMVKAKVPGATKFAAFVRAMRKFFGLNLSRAAVLKKAEQDGKLDAAEMERFREMVMGETLQDEYEAEVVSEYEQNFQPSEEVPFSLGDSEIAESLIGDVTARIKRPEVRARVMGDIRRRLDDIKLEAERMRQIFGKENQKIVVDPRSSKELRKEAAERRERREEELVIEVLQNEGRVLDADAALKLKDMPIHGAIANPGKGMRGGMLESKSAFIKRTGKYPGPEYEGSEGMVNSLLFGGGRSPDQMSRELFEAGLLKEDSPEAMWEALSQERESVAQNREDVAKAKKAIAGAKKQARLESQKWLEEQNALQARDQNPVERMRRSLAVLDSILMALPVELRGRVGGFVQIARLGSDEARLKFLHERIEKIDDVLDRWLNTEFDKQAQSLMKRAGAFRREVGKTDKGKHDYLLHQLFDQVQKSMTLDAAGVRRIVAGIEKELEERQQADAISPEMETQLEQMALLVEQFGDWEHRTAAEKEAALKNGWHVFFLGYNRAVQARILQREKWELSRSKLIKDTGTKDDPGERDEKRQEEQTWRGWKEWGQGFLDFGQALGWTFGIDSKEANKFEEWEREADYQKKDRMYGHQTAIEAFWTSIAGGDAVEGLRKQYEVQTQVFEIVNPSKGGRKAHTRKLTLGQMIQARMMWRQPDGRRHMEGHEGYKDQENNVIVKPSKWAYTQEFMDNIDKAMTPEARMLEEFLTQQYGKEYDTLNEVHVRVNGIELPKNPLYSPLTVAPHSQKSGEMVDPLTGQTVNQASMQPTSIIRRSQSAVAEPKFVDALHTFYGHKAQIEHWMAYAEFSKELNMVLNNRDVRNAIEAKRGVEGLNTLAQWQKIFNEGGIRDSVMTIAAMQGLQRGMGRLAQAALVGRVSVLAIQSTQLGAALAHMPTGSYLKRVAKLASGRLNWGETMKSEFIQRRLQQAPPAVRMAMEQMRTAKPSKAKYLAHKMGNLISGADAFFTSATYAIIYDYQVTKLGKSSKEAHKAAEKLTEEVAQPVRSGKRSLFENMAKNPFFTLQWAFASESRQKLMLAIYKGFTGRTRAEKARALAVTWGFGGAMAAVIRAMMADMRDDEDDEFFDDKHWNVSRLTAQTLAGPFSGFPIVGDLTEGAAFGLFRMMGLKPGYLPEGNVIDAVPKGVKSAVRMAENVTTDEEYEDFDTIIRDVDVMVNGAAMFHDSAAAYSSFIHFGRDLFRIGKNTIGD